MKVIHYIPSLRKDMGQAALSVQVLHSALASRKVETEPRTQDIESHLYTGRAASSDFYNYLKKIKPDIVHIHGCWNKQTAIAQLMSHYMGCPVILSPHGALSPKVLQSEFWKKRLPRIILYQFRTIRNSFVLHAETEEELNDLKSLGWKKRISQINIPYGINANASLQAPQDAAIRDMCDAFSQLYNKVFFTSVRNCLTEAQRNSLNVLLKIAIDYKYRQQEIDEEQKTTIENLSERDWTLMQVYALDHGVFDIMLQGAKFLNTTPKADNKVLPDRYKAKQILHEGTATDLSLVKEEFKDYPTEYALAMKMKTLNDILCNHVKSEECPYPLVCLLHIYETMRWKEYNENVFYDMLVKIGIKPFASRVVQMLSDMFGLTIGFMPVDPTKDREVKRIANNLNNIA